VWFKGVVDAVQANDLQEREQKDSKSTLNQAPIGLAAR